MRGAGGPHFLSQLIRGGDVWRLFPGALSPQPPLLPPRHHRDAPSRASHPPAAQPGRQRPEKAITASSAASSPLAPPYPSRDGLSPLYLDPRAHGPQRGPQGSHGGPAWSSPSHFTAPCLSFPRFAALESGCKRLRRWHLSATTDSDPERWAEQPGHLCTAPRPRPWGPGRSMRQSPRRETAPMSPPTRQTHAGRFTPELRRQRGKGRGTGRGLAARCWPEPRSLGGGREVVTRRSAGARGWSRAVPQGLWLCAPRWVSPDVHLGCACVCGVSHSSTVYKTETG